MIATAMAASFAAGLCRVVLTVIAAIAATLLALRLLGIRRGWGTALLASLVG